MEATLPQPSFFRKYGKALVSVLVAAIVALKVALTDDTVTDVEWVQISIAATGAVLTFVIPVAPQWRWGKTVANAVMAVLLVLVTLIVGGLDSSEWIELVVVGAGAFGVLAVPAVSGGVEAAPGISDTPPDVHDDLLNLEDFPDGDHLESTDFSDDEGYDEAEAHPEEEH